MRTDPRPDQVRLLVRRVLDEISSGERKRREGETRRQGDRECLARLTRRASPPAKRPSPLIPNPQSLIPFLRLDETILIDRGRCVARSYRTDGYLAMWLLEVGIVQFYNAEGDMLLTVNLFESFRGQRMAA